MKILVDKLPMCSSECLFLDYLKENCNIDNDDCTLKHKGKCDKLADLKTESEGE